MIAGARGEGAEWHGVQGGEFAAVQSAQRWEVCASRQRGARGAHGCPAEYNRGASPASGQAQRAAIRALVAPRRCREEGRERGRERHRCGVVDDKLVTRDVVGADAVSPHVAADQFRPGRSNFWAALSLQVRLNLNWSDVVSSVCLFCFGRFLRFDSHVFVLVIFYLTVSSRATAASSRRRSRRRARSLRRSPPRRAGRAAVACFQRRRRP